jgi:hypothetical protein
MRVPGLDPGMDPRIYVFRAAVKAWMWPWVPDLRAAGERAGVARPGHEIACPGRVERACERNAIRDPGATRRLVEFDRSYATRRSGRNEEP